MSEQSSNVGAAPEPKPVPEPVPVQAVGERAGGEPPAGGTSRAATVAAGILTSRLFGFLRELAQAHFFANTAYGDVFRAALRAPNALQNLLGEGSLSASFIPIYSKFLAEGRERDARRLAGAVFGLLLVAVSAAVLLGIAFAEPLMRLLTPGFVDDAAAGGVDRFVLVVAAVKILFPMTGLLVLSVWALGILNSHRRFLLSYTAPVAWNCAIIAALLWASGMQFGGGEDGRTERLLFAACWGALAGGALQFLVQLPWALKLLGGFRPSLSLGAPGVRRALTALGPVVAGRGVVQLAGWLDLVLASYLAAGAVAAVGSGQFLFFLPVSLFGMSVAASELPELARHGGAREPDGKAAGLSAAFVDRLRRGLRQSAFLTAPTVVGYLLFGWLLVSALFLTGKFGRDDVWLVYLVLAAYSLGLLASTLSRLLQNSFYALEQTRLPAKVAVVRVTISALFALLVMFRLDEFGVSAVAPGVRPSALRLGGVALALGSALGAWVELIALSWALGRRVEGWALPVGRVAGMLALALAAAVPPGGLWWWLGHSPLPLRLTAAAVVGLYAAGYLAAAYLLHFPELGSWLGRLRRK